MLHVCVGITKKTQVIKGELNPVWNEVRPQSSSVYLVCFWSLNLFLFYMPLKFERMLSKQLARQ